MIPKKKILASVSVLLVLLLVSAAITYAAPEFAQVEIKPIQTTTSILEELQGYSEGTQVEIKPIQPPEVYLEEAGAYTRIISSYDNFAKPGETIVVKGSVKNYGDSEITVELVPIVYEGYPRAYKYRNVIEPEWVSVEPKEINLGAGESTSFNISVSIPADADTGYYDGMIAIRTNKYPERVEHYSVQVYKPLEEPIIKEFSVPPNSTKVIVTVKWGEDRISTKGTVDVHLFDSNGSEVSQKARMTRISGYVDAFDYAPKPIPVVWEGIEETANVRERHTVIYQIENPASGTWKLEMMPDNVMRFSYDIVVNPVE